MDGKGNCYPKRCLNYISHSALEAQGCLCLNAFWELKLRSGLEGIILEDGTGSESGARIVELAGSFGLAWNP